MKIVDRIKTELSREKNKRLIVESNENTRECLRFTADMRRLGVLRPADQWVVALDEKKHIPRVYFVPNDIECLRALGTSLTKLEV